MQFYCKSRIFHILLLERSAQFIKKMLGTNINVDKIEVGKKAAARAAVDEFIQVRS